MTLTQNRLKEVLKYDRRSGVFIWRISRPACRAGDRAGSTKTNGYRRIGIDGKLYAEHRLAWLYVKGYWPVEVDHRDGARSNNVFKNLREATRPQNAQNLKAQAGTSSGLTGVTRFRNKWQAQIAAGGKYRYLGLYATRGEAQAAYAKAKAALHSFQPHARI